MRCMKLRCIETEIIKAAKVNSRACMRCSLQDNPQDSAPGSPQDWKHSLDLAAVLCAKDIRIDTLCWSTFVAKQDSCHL